MTRYEFKRLKFLDHPLPGSRVEEVNWVQGIRAPKSFNQFHDKVINQDPWEPYGYKCVEQVFVQFTLDYCQSWKTWEKQ